MPSGKEVEIFAPQEVLPKAEYLFSGDIPCALAFSADSLSRSYLSHSC